MKKQNVIISLIILIIIFLSTYFFLSKVNKELPTGSDMKVEIIKNDIQELSKEFDISLSDTIISLKYKMTCSLDKCNFNVPFNFSGFSTLDRNRTKIFLKIRTSNETFRFVGDQIDDTEDKISFIINNPKPGSIFEFYAVVVYNPSIQRVISE